MTNPEPIDLNFVTEDVQGGTWLQWATSIANLTDLVDKAIARASGPPRKCIRRLVIAAHGATHTDGFTVFDAETTGAEYIDGSNKNSPLSGGVEAQLRRLRPYFCTDAIVEFRVCRFGTGDNGARAMQMVADILGVPVTAPTDSISSLAAIGGLATSWRTTYPSDWGKPSVVSFWRGDPESKPAPPPPPPPARPPVTDVAPITGQTVTGQYVPLRGVNPPTLTPPATLPTPSRSGIGSRVAAGATAGLLLVAVGAGIALNRGGGDATSVAPPASGTASSASPPAIAPPVEVRVSPIEAVFNQSAFTTTYTVLFSSSGPAPRFEWSGADCGTFGAVPGEPQTFRWVHPHPPCDPTTDHANRTITLQVTAGERQFRCTYQGAASGVGPPCIDVRTGAVTTPVGGGR